VIGGRILGRSFMEAYRQAAASSTYQRAAQARNPDGSASNGGGGVSLASSMTLEEACNILNVKKPAKGQVATTLAEATERYKQLFDANDPEKGGSFYLQSKVVRAHERLEREARPMAAQDEVDSTAKKGWKPNIHAK
jgi:import inner membrane translocase subunit TIM16